MAGVVARGGVVDAGGAVRVAGRRGAGVIAR